MNKCPANVNSINSWFRFNFFFPSFFFFLYFFNLLHNNENSEIKQINWMWRERNKRSCSLLISTQIRNKQKKNILFSLKRNPSQGKWIECSIEYFFFIPDIEKYKKKNVDAAKGFFVFISVLLSFTVPLRAFQTNERTNDWTKHKNQFVKLVFFVSLFCSPFMLVCQNSVTVKLWKTPGLWINYN